MSGGLGKALMNTRGRCNKRSLVGRAIPHSNSAMVRAALRWEWNVTELPASTPLRVHLKFSCQQHTFRHCLSVGIRILPLG